MWIWQPLYTKGSRHQVKMNIGPGIDKYLPVNGSMWPLTGQNIVAITSFKRFRQSDICSKNEMHAAHVKILSAIPRSVAGIIRFIKWPVSLESSIRRGTVREQHITWTNVNHVLWRHIVTMGKFITYYQMPRVWVSFRDIYSTIFCSGSGVDICHKRAATLV